MAAEQRVCHPNALTPQRQSLYGTFAEDCMRKVWRGFAAVSFWLLLVLPNLAIAGPREAADVLRTWQKFALELTRHTATYSPPVASRSFAYLGITGFEAAASGSPTLNSLAGQLNGLTPLPKRESGKSYDERVVLNSALGAAVSELFSNTGPTGQRVLQRLMEKLTAEVSEGVAADIAIRSETYGKAVAAHIIAWSKQDGGADIVNMGFPLAYTAKEGPAFWTPTSVIGQQQAPLLPDWGKNRTFAMPNGASCPLPAPPEYSEDKNSEFYKQALEVFETKKSLTDEQRAIARFWSDDPMLSPTPPGHWISIALQVLDRENADLDTSADLLARLGITLADAFIGCWHTKFEYDLLRPVTYIRRTMDPKWESTMNTPPFPEYPSGHSTQSAAAAEVLTAFFGDDYAFEDATHQKDKLKPRKFASFRAAAEEAGISRLYGGIHFRAAVERGLEQGRCIGAYANKLVTRK
jgi:PAP2 superfamily